MQRGLRASATCYCLSCFRQNKSLEKISGILHNPAFLHGCLFNLQSIIAGKRKTHNHKSGLEFIERFSKYKPIINSADTLQENSDFMHSAEVLVYFVVFEQFNVFIGAK